MDSSNERNSDFLRKLSPIQQETLLNQLRKARESSADSENEGISSHDPLTTSFPLSFSQERIWFFEKFEPGTATYNIPIAIHLQGVLEFEFLQQSVREIIKRHEILRTSFASVDGQPSQVVSSDLDLSIPFVDIHNVENIQQKSMDIITNEATIPFDLERAPLFRTKLLQLGARDYIFVIVFHHLICDHWSLSIFAKELVTIYHAFKTGKPYSLPIIKVQYSDFALWQRNKLRGEEYTKQLNYWKKKLEDAPPVITLMIEKPRTQIQTYSGGRKPVFISKELYNSLSELSHNENVTIFMILIATFQCILSPYSGQEDIVVGTPIANRRHPTLEGLIGFFANNLIFRTDVSGNPTFREILSRVREVAISAYDNQDLPFERLVEELAPERVLSHHPLFQVMLVLQNTPSASFDLPDLNLQLQWIETGTIPFDLIISLLEENDCLHGWLEYNTDLFESETMDRMVQHFCTLLEAVASNPDVPISQLSMMTESEKHRVLMEWNDTEADYRNDACLHTLFEEQVDRTPAKIAAVFQDQQLTYVELNTRANQLAQYLRRLGIGRESLVGICQDRSLDMLVSTLAVFKAGGAYVPLDPGYPIDRLAFMVKDSHLSILLTCQEQMDIGQRLAEESGEIQIIVLDRDWEIISQENSENLIPQATAENLAYVIYTSGSTGRPKGVQIPHDALVNLLSAMKKQPGLTAEDTFVAVTTLSFDIAGLELYLPLLTGAQLVIASREVTIDGKLLLNLLLKSEATVMQATPVTWRLLLDAGWQGKENFKALCGGEALPRELANHLLEKRIQLWNMYGPTETTIWSSVGLVTSGEATVTIGRPIANTQFYILDKHFNPVAEGLPGELHIAGDGLARGYLNRPALTAQHFLPNPFSQEPGRRMYKTGDLVRYLRNGNLEFFGRLDQQVKIRGFRIELGEIETTMLQYPGVKAAVALSKEIEGLQHLVAYYVAESEIQEDDLRHYLKDKLPPYMLPSIFQQLESLPYTPNGKIDYRALPEIQDWRVRQSREYVPPRNLLESTLAEIWCSCLGLERVGIHDDFFHLGGHSLIALQIVSRISSLINIDISVKFLFLYPTIAELAEAVSKESNSWSKAFRSVQIENTTQVFPKSSYLKIVRRSIVESIRSGTAAPIESAALDYLSMSPLQISTMPSDQVIRGWLEDSPLAYRVRETSWGRVGNILLPQLSTTLYDNETQLVKTIISALKLAYEMGAQTVSLTGLIPSATRYGISVTEAINDQPLPMITTGHPTTTAAVIMTITRVLEECGRELINERVGFLGLGSIGTAVLRLMLQCLPHPSEIILCDVFNKHDYLELLRLEIKTQIGFSGKIKILESGRKVSSSFYDATMIIGATNVPSILNIAEVKPGTVIIDDSTPNCFDNALAFHRFEEQKDILFTEGGVLEFHSPIPDLFYLPRSLKSPWVNIIKDDIVSNHNPFHMTGCVFSSLLSVVYPHLKPSLGSFDVKSSWQHYLAMQDMGIRAARLHCGNYYLLPDTIKEFRHHYGRVN